MNIEMIKYYLQHEMLPSTDTEMLPSVLYPNPIFKQMTCESS